MSVWRHKNPDAKIKLLHELEGKEKLCNDRSNN